MSRTGAHGIQETSGFLILLHFLLNSKSLMSISLICKFSIPRIYFVVGLVFFFFFNSFIFTGPAQALKTEATQEQTVKGTPDLSLVAAFACIRQTDM